MATRGGRTVQPPPLLQLRGGREESRTFSRHFILAILFLLHFYLLFFIQPWIYFSPAIMTLSFLHAHNALPPDTLACLPRILSPKVPWDNLSSPTNRHFVSFYILNKYKHRPKKKKKYPICPIYMKSGILFSTYPVEDILTFYSILYRTDNEMSDFMYTGQTENFIYFGV